MTAIELAAGIAVAAGAALQSATGFGFSLVAAPLLFAATEPAEAVGLLILLGAEVNLLTLAGERRRPRPLCATARVLLGVGAAGRAGGRRRAARARRRRAPARRRPPACWSSLAVRWRTQRATAGPVRPPPRWARPVAGLAAGALTTSTTTAGPPLVLLPAAAASPPRPRCATRSPSCFLGLSRRSGALALARHRHARRGAGRAVARRCSSPPSLAGHLAGRPRVRAPRARVTTSACSPASCSSRSASGSSPRCSDRDTLHVPRRLTRETRMAQEHGDRLTAVDASFLAQEGADLAHARRRRAASSRARRRPTTTSPTTSARACTSCRATGRSSPSRRSRPAARCGSTTRASTSSTTCATPALPAPGSEEQLRALAARIHSQQLDRSKPLWETVARPGARGQPLRADLQDPPRARRRHLRRRPRSTVLFDLAAGPAAAAARGRAVGAAARAERARHGRPRGARAGARCRSSWRAARCRRRDASRRDAGRRARGARGPRRDRLGRPEPGARHAAERADRPAPAVRVRAQRAGRLQARQERVRRHGQRRRAGRRRRRAARRGCARAACAPRGSSCARSCRCRSAPRTSAASSATGSRSCAGRCRSTSRTRSRACSVVRQAMDGLKESKQAVGAEVLTSRAEPRAADDPRAGLAAELLHAAVQPARDERARAAVPALRARARAAGPVPDRVPAQATTRSRSRSCPTTAGSTSACSATTTRCRDLDDVRRARSSDALAELVTAAKARRRRRRRAAPEGGGAGRSVAEGELRVLGHLVRGPRGREDHVRDDLVDARDLADELLHLLGDLRADRARGRRQREGDGRRCRRRSRRRRPGRARRNRGPSSGSMTFESASRTSSSSTIGDRV